MERKAKVLTNIFRISAVGGALATYYHQNEESQLRKLRCMQNYLQILNRPSAQALVRDDEDLKRLKSIKTNVYVWGEGFQVDPTQDYSNFTPKKIQQFKGHEKPNIVDVAFGWYHEAYIDHKGALHVCAKAKLSSIEVDTIRDGDRGDLHTVSNLPRGTKVKQVAFTQSRMFVLSEKGEVFLYKIQEHFPKREDLDLFGSKAASQIRGELMVNEAPKPIKNLKDIKQIACGIDHVIFLNKQGELLAMGDDTFGQCGVGGDARQATAPFFEERHGVPVSVQIPYDSKGKPQRVKKIACGFRHSLAITENGKLFGWGYNNQQQISHAQEYADESSPMHAIFTPQRIAGPLDDLFVMDAACGEEMSVIVAHGKKAGIIFEQVYACGNNLKGSLGINRTSHLQDLTLVPDLSDLFDEKEEALMVNHLQCGRRHCVATFDFGAFMFWGDNQVGQLGNRRRSFVESPYPSKKFEYRHNVENVVLGIDSSAVIVEDTGRVKKKNTKKNKRMLKLNEVVANEAELKLRSEAMITKEKEDKSEKLDGRGRRSLSERIREKVHSTFYGDKVKNDKPVGGPGSQSALQAAIAKEKADRENNEAKK